MQAKRSVIIGAISALGLMVGATSALAAPVLFGHSGWTWGNPTPQGDTLRNVVFVGARGFAVGFFGAVLRSDDGGTTWIGLPSGTSDTLSLVQELNPKTVVVGGQCTVRESVDAGASFRRFRINANEDYCPTGEIASFSFLDPSMGFVEEADGTILLTTDGGRTLGRKTPVPLAGATAAKLDFISPMTGFALTGGKGGGRIFRTTDGADSWTQVASSPAPLSDVTFVTPATAYAVGGSTLLRSTDGGGTWTPLPLVLPADAQSVTQPRISCSDITHCLILTARPPVGSGSVLVRTIDGGVTGSLVSLSQPVLAMSFSTATDVVAVGYDGETVLSSDGGATFPTQISNSLGKAIPRVIRIGQSPLDAYASWTWGEIAATTDGGNRWSLLTVPRMGNLKDVAFPTTEIGYALDTTGRVFRTSNTGLTWSALSFRGQAPSALLAPSANSVLLIGPAGVWRSTNAGGSFDPINATVVTGHRHGKVERVELASFSVSGGAQTAGGAIFAYGEDVLESTNGGTSWTLIPRPLPMHPVVAISFISPTTGYEISDRRMFFTSSRGRSWRELPAVGAPIIDAPGLMSFSSALDGYVLPLPEAHIAPNVLLRTENGGRTWTPEPLPTALTTVTAAGAVDYAAGGLSGEPWGGLFETTDGGLHVSPSTLTLAIVGRHKLSAAELRKAGNRVRLIGHLSPALGGEHVFVSYRTGGGSWHKRAARATSNGTFALTVPGIKATTDFVAQWLGSGPITGAGTPATRFTVGRR